MRITGTKKLLIILFAVICAVAAGIGVLYAKPSSAFADAAPESAAETEAPVDIPDGEELVDSEQEQYDERFDEARIRALAEVMEIDYEILNFYAHANDISIAQLEDEYYSELLASPESDGYTLDEDALALEEDAEHEHNHEHDENGNCIFSDDNLSDRVANFKNSYANGEVKLDADAEDEDWFLSPDEAGSYISIIYHGWQRDYPTQFISSTRGALSLSWTYNFPSVAGWGDVYQSASFVFNQTRQDQFNLRPSQGGCGQYTTITLDPGEMFTFQTYCARVDAWYSQYTQSDAHWYSQNGGTEQGQTMYYIADGDSPGTSYFMHGFGFINQQVAHTNLTYGRIKPNNMASCTTNGSGATYWSKIWWQEVIIIRRDAARPVIVDEGDGATISGNTKTMKFDGTPAKISFYPDYGSCLLTWAASSPEVTIYDRAIHGAAVKNLTLQVAAAGTYTITLTSESGSWADGSTGSVIFTFILENSKTSKPTLLRETGVSSNGKEKYVNDTGQAQTITFTNCDPAYLKWESNGLKQASWENNTLVLYQTLQNVYSISISIVNPKACSWSDGGTMAQGFTFTIGPMVIDKMDIEGLPSGTLEKTVTYNKSDQTMVLTPAREGSLNIVASGINIEYDHPTDNPVGKLIFTTRNSANFYIQISPASGYVWPDQTNTTYTYIFRIQKIKIDRPTLDEPTASGGTKTVTYDPYGDSQTLKVKGISYDEVEITTAMTYSPAWEGTDVTFSVRNAGSYYVVIAPEATNYEWKTGGNDPITFVLEVERYKLSTPQIVISDYERQKGQITGDTKTVDYEGPDADKYLKLSIGVVGGVDADGNAADAIADQVTVTNDGLTETWDLEGHTLTLSGMNAKNYLIRLVPTPNYMWTDGSYVLKDFKLVITPIYLDAIPMAQSASLDSGYELSSGNRANLEYDGTPKRIKVGNTNSEITFFDPTRMRWDFVDAGGNVIGGSQTEMQLESSGRELVFYAINSGEYIVRVQLLNSNYAWRDGSGVDLYFTLIIDAQPIAAPYLLKTECGGYKTEGNIEDDRMHGTYNGQQFTMAIAVKYAPNVVKPEFNSDEIWQSEWTEAEKFGRLVVHCIETGEHYVTLRISDKNFRWEEDVPYYRFTIRVNYAEVTGVEFYADVVYEQDGEVIHDGILDIGGDGASYSSTFIPKTEQSILVKRADPLEFTTTEYESQFTVEVRSSNNHTVLRTDWNGTENITLPFMDADRYSIYIGLTKNYSWANGGREPYYCTFTIGPKTVSLPEIFDYADGSVYVDQRSRNVEYNRQNQQLMIELGSDWEAFKVADADDMEIDKTVTDPSVFAYLAKNAGTHTLRIALADVYNYTWEIGAGSEYEFRLIIAKHAVKVPEAFVTTEEGYATAKTTGTPINPDLVNKIIRTYTGTPYYIYLFGEVIDNHTIENSDVEITVSTKNAPSQPPYSQPDTADGRTVAWKFYSTTVNEYTLTVSFPDGTHNLYWEGTSEDETPRTFTLEIIKKVVTVPKIKGEEAQVLKDDSFSKTFVYAVSTHQQIEILGFLSQYNLMKTTTNASLARATYDHGTQELIFTTDLGTGGNAAAFVGREYCLSIDLDYENERWDVPDNDPNNNGQETAKKYYIVIEKFAVSMPSVVNDGDPNATAYTQTSKTVTYNGSKWSNIMKITGIDTDWMSYKIGLPSAMQSTFALTATGTNGHFRGELTISTDAAATSYPVILSLSDPANLCWDVADKNSNDISFEFIVDPVKLDKPVVNATDTGVYAGNNNGALGKPGTPGYSATPVFTAVSKQLTYEAGRPVSLFIDFLDYAAEQSFGDQISYEVISSFTFTKAEYNKAVDGGTKGYFEYIATDAGTYTVRFTLSQNAQWADGTRDPLDISLIIEKIVHTTPSIIPYQPSDSSIIDDFTRSVDYKINASVHDGLVAAAEKQQLSIDNYDMSIMSFYDATLPNGWQLADNFSEDEINKIFTLWGGVAGTYTVTFRLSDFKNNRWAYADKETVTFTFEIKELELDNPTFEGDFLLNGDTLSNNNTRLNATFGEGITHGVILPDILGSDYMYYTSTGDTNSFIYTDQKDIIKNNFVNNSNNTDGYIYDIATLFGYTASSMPALANGKNPTDGPDSLNFIVLKAKDTGVYTLTFNLRDPENMVWKDGTKTAKTVTINIEKIRRSAPTMPGGTSKVYNGDYQTFTINNAFNGCMNATEFANNSPSDYATEGYAFVSSTVTTGDNQPVIQSWYNGVLTLAVREVGTYKVRVFLLHPETTSWSNNAAKEIIFTFSITKRPVNASVKFTAAGSTTNTTSWSVDTDVTATITLGNIAARDDGAGNKVIDLDTLAASIYFIKNGTTAKIKEEVKTAQNLGNPLEATAVLQGNGTYNVSFTFAMPYGADNIEKGNYTFYVAQYSECNRYTLAQKQQGFTIGANPAPFSYTDLVWQYVIDNDPSQTVHTLALNDWYPTNSSNTFKLPYLTDGGIYQFSLSMTPNGMAGFGGGASYTEVENALVSWKVKLDKYNGSRNAMYAGKYTVSVVISASEPDTYAFATTTYTLHYEITPAKYDISGLSWDYSGTPFVYDGTAHKVLLTGTYPTGLTVKSYKVNGYDLNSQIYAGSYTTTVEFASSNKNYILPDLTDPTTYLGTAPAPCAWAVDPAYLDVGWTDKQTSDGVSVAYVPMLSSHDEKVDYVYEIEDSTQPSGWRVVSLPLSRNGSQKYRVTATLKSNPTNPEANYARNYILRFTPATDNPHEFVLGENEDGIGIKMYAHNDSVATDVQLSTNPASPTKVKYNGDTYTGVPDIFDNPNPTGISDANLVITYYSVINDKKPIDAPTAAGSYIIKVTLVNLTADGKEYYLSDTAFYFEIEKGDLNADDIFWQYTHTDGNGVTVTAIWDKDAKVWKNTADGSAVTFVFDGYGHTVELISNDPNLVVNTKNKANIHAGDYTSRASLSYDTNKWNDPDIASEMDWTVEKAVINLALLDWDYTGNFVYEIVAGKATEYSVKVNPNIADANVENYLLDYISYKTFDSIGNEISGKVSNAGSYTTTCTIASFPDDSDYELGDWPATIPTTLAWTIDVKEIDLPVSNATWDVFDGLQHDLLTILTFDLDWKEYFNLTINYNGGSGFAPYDGTVECGYKYTALNAGKYEYVLSLNSGINTATQTNVVWYDGTNTTTDDQKVVHTVAKAELLVTDWKPTAAQEGVLAKAELSGNYVNIWGADAASRFIGYKFHEYDIGTGTKGNQVSLNDVLNSSGKTFSIEPFVKDEYTNNITLTFDTGVDNYQYFTTLDLDDPQYEDNQHAVAGRPYINGYESDGAFHEFTVDEWKEFLGIDEDFWKNYLKATDLDGTKTNKEVLLARKAEEEKKNPSTETPDGPSAQADGDEGEEQPPEDTLTEEDWNLIFYAYELLSKAKVYVTYSGSPVRFTVHNWDTQYGQMPNPILQKWGGDDLTQSAAGSYSIVYSFIQSTSYAYYWTVKEEGGKLVYDRSSVELKFEIRYLMLDVPELKDVTFRDELIYILGESYDEQALKDLLATYGDFVEIKGETATDAGTYKLYLTIDEEHANTVRWNNGTAFGQPGTYEVEWKILPIYIDKPVLDTSKSITYDGAEHSVFEVLVGYTEEGMSEELQRLMQYVRIPGDGSRGINAGAYKAQFILPDSNYAWKDLAGGIDTTHTAITIEWKINKKFLDMSNLSWTYDKNDPFKYTFENGTEKSFTLELLGLPEELEEFVSYLTYTGASTTGVAGNTASKVNNYKTVLYLFENDATLIANYELGSIDNAFYNEYRSSTGYLEISWKIEQRQYTVPTAPGSSDWTEEKNFDGDLHDIMELLGLGDDWFNYFTVDVTYIGDGDGSKNYDATKDPAVGYSVYNVLYVGTYKLTVTIKPELNKGTNNVVWIIGGNENTGVQNITLNYNPTDIEITGWNEDLHLSTIISSDFDNLSDFTKDLFEYVIYDVDENKVYTVEEIESRGVGYNYAIYFQLKADYINSFAYKQGINLTTAAGVENPYGFGKFDFGTQPIIMLPIPTLDAYTKEFTAEELKFTINDWDTVYTWDATKKAAFEAAYPAFPVTSDYFLYSIGNLKLRDDGSVGVVAAGDYKLTVRFSPNINLAWYDPATHFINADNELESIADGTKVALTEEALKAAKLLDRYAKSFNFTVTKASIRHIDTSEIVDIPTLEYTGSTQDITSRGQLQSFIDNLKARYGSLITISGNKGINAGDYELVISLTDPESSFWDLGENTYVEVKADGYKLMYVAQNDIRLVLVNEDGEIVKGDDGKFIEYNNGNYTKINPTDPNAESGIKFKKGYRIGSYIPVFEDLASKDGKKVPLTQTVDGQLQPVTRYAQLVDGKYVIREFEVELSGTDYVFALSNGNYKFTDVEEEYVFAEIDGEPLRYTLKDNGGYDLYKDGKYVAIYAYDENGELIERGDLIGYDGNPVIDYELSKVYELVRKTSTDPITIKWQITKASINIPTANDEYKITYTGNEINIVELAKDGALIGFDPNLMEITENATAVDAGPHAAKVKFTEEAAKNYYWGDNPDLEFVTVIWTIDKGVLDLSGIYWTYSWDTEKGDPEYTRKDGVEQIYWVGLGGVPDAVKDNLVFTTNGKEGAYAGRKAGRYVTSFKFLGLDGVEDENGNIVYENFDDIIWPENLEELSTVTWYIKRHKLDLPELDTSKPWVVFDDGVHDLRDMLKLPDGWEEYCNVLVSYASNYLVFLPYEGYDNGDGLKWYLAHGAGAYRFTIEIKSGINVNASNPSVVWNDGSADDGNTEPGTPETITFILNAIAKEEEENADEPVIDLNDPEAVQYVEGDEESDGGEQTPPEAEEPAPEPPKTPGEGDIADPDPDYSEDDKWIDEIQQITMNVDKLRVTATNWTGADAAARLALDYSRYEDAAKVEEIIKAVLKYKYYDTLGKEVSTVDMKAGCTYFVHPELDGKYGDYIEIEYKDGVKKSYDFSLDFTDDKPYDEIDLPEGIEPGSKYTVILDSKVYTGLDIEFVIEFLAQHQGVLQIVASESDSLIQKNAGKYRVTVCFQDEIKACWKGQANHDRTAITFEFEITQKEISLGGTTGLGEIAYTGKEIDINAILKELDFGGYVIVEYGSEDKRTDVGEYKVTIRLNPEYGDNVKWSSDTQLNADGRTVTLVWHITQATINGTWNELGRLTLESESYVGGTEGKIEYKYYTDAELTQEVSGTSLKAGTKYWVKAILLDTVNLKWADGFKDVHEFTLEVELILLPKPELIFDTQEYTGQEITFNILNPNQYTGHIEIVEGELTQQEIGVYTVVIRLVGDGAVWDTGSTDDVTLTFEITQTVISGEWIEGAGVMDLTSAYRGSYAGIVEYVYTDSDGNVISKANLVKGETYTVTVTLKDTEHFRWADGQELTQTFTFTAEIVVVPKLSLKESEVFYTGEAITAVIVDYEKYRDNLQSVRLSYTEAGTYEIRLRLKGAAEWEAGISGELVLTFTIKKVVLKGTWTDEGRIEFEENSYKGDYAEVVEYIYKDVNGNIVSASELREGEVYTATVRLKEGKGANFDDSELVKEYEFTYKSVKKGISWWVILLIIIAIILIILIIVVIIYTQRKRKRLREEALQEEQYEASGAYGDEYDSEYDYGNADYNADNAGATDYGADGATDFPSDIPSDGTDTF